MARLGIDIGATKIAAGCFEGSSVISFQMVQTPREREPDALWSAVAELAGQVLDAAGQPSSGFDGIGAGCPGPLDSSLGLVSPTLIEAWRSFPLRARLEERFQYPVVVGNDADAFALAESRFGKGQRARCLLGLVVSTGVGAGIVIERRLFRGARGNPGEIAHVFVGAKDLACPLGTEGCLGGIASGAALSHRYRELLRKDRGVGVQGHATGSAAELNKVAERGDDSAITLLEDAGASLGRAVGSAAHILDLDMVVLGGGVARRAPILVSALRRELSKRGCLPSTKELPVLVSSLGDSAGCLGACCFLDEPALALGRNATD